MRRLPSSIENAVVASLYTDAAAVGWEGLTLVQRSAQYDRWVHDPAIGGKLTGYLDASAARVWIKDGPMKEWSRALSGVGKYAPLVAGRGDTQARIVRKALGEGWEAAEDTLHVKPLRLTARNGEDEAVVTWAPAQGLKHMVWAAMVASAEGDARRWVVCVTDSFTKPTPANESQAHQRIAKRCGLELVHVRL